MRVLTANLFHRVVGGAERYYFTVQRLLRERGHEVAAFSTIDPRNEPSETGGYFVDGIRAPSQVSWWRRLAGIPRYVASRQARRNMRRLVRDFRPDVAHVHTLTYWLTPAVLEPLREAGVPILQTLHGYKPVCPVTSMLSNDRPCEGCGPGRFHQVLTRRCNEGKFTVSLVNFVESSVNRRAWDSIDRFLSPSRFCADLMKRFRAIPEERLEVLPYCLDEVPPEAEGDGDYLLYFGRLSPEKGLRVLMEASRLAPEIPLRIAGEGEMFEELRSRAGPRVEFSGYRQGGDLRRLVSGSRATVLPSLWYENYPLSVMESFALARPAIGSRTGGIPELIEPGRTGWLVPPGDASSLASAMREAWNGIRRTRELGREARAWAIRELDPARHADRLLEIYRKVA